jgi:tryptophan synthase alpha chain
MSGDVIPAPGTERIAAVFAKLRQKDRRALVIYLMAGDPNPAFTEQLVPALAEAGADLIELGFPFSDPVADGPVIQAASQRAIAQFSGLDPYLDMVKRIRAKTAIPLVCMTYYNLIFRYGEQAFLVRARAVGLDGAIIPDLPLDEGQDWRELCAAHGVASIYLEAPNTTPEHAKEIAKASQGFIYLVSLKGVTGAAKGLGENLEDRIARLRQAVDTPLLVGFGISTPEQARTYSRISDGVIVGSAVVKQIEQAGSAESAQAAVVDLVKRFRTEMDRA